MKLSKKTLGIIGLSLWLCCWGEAAYARHREGASYRFTNGSAYGYYLAAHTFSDRHNYDQAVALYQKMIAVSPSLPFFVWDDIFKTSLAAGRFDVALQVGKHLDAGSMFNHTVLLLQYMKEIKFYKNAMAFRRMEALRLDDFPEYFEKYPVLVMRIALDIAHHKSDQALLDVETFKEVPFFYDIYQFYYAYVLYHKGHYHQSLTFLDDTNRGDLFFKMAIRLKMRLFLALHEKKELNRYIDLLNNQDLYAPDIESDVTYWRTNGTLPPMFSSPSHEIAGMLSLMAQKIDSIRPDQALVYARMALWLSPSYFVRYHAGNVLYDVGQVKDAQRILNSMSQKSPYYRDMVLRIASYEMIHHQTTSALVRIKKLLKWYPNYIDGLALYAQLLSQKGDYKKSVATYNKAINILAYTQYQEYWMLFMDRGKTYAALHMFKKAEKDLKYAQSLKPDDVDIQIALAEVWIAEGKNMNKAINALEDSLDDRSNDANLLLQLGIAYYKVGKLKDAQNTLFNALALDPFNAHINQILGDVSHALGNNKLSMLQWNRAKKYASS